MKVSQKITRLHKLKRMEEEILRFLLSSDQEQPAYKYTLQEFFEYIAIEQDKEKGKEGIHTTDYNLSRKQQKFLTEEEKTEMIQEYISEPNKRGFRKKLAIKYDVHEATVYNITKFLK